MTFCREKSVETYQRDTIVILLGWELPEYEFSDAAKGQHTCRVELVHSVLNT